MLMLQSQLRYIISRPAQNNATTEEILQDADPASTFVLNLILLLALDNLFTAFVIDCT